MLHHTPTSTLFPYTTLFRSQTGEFHTDRINIRIMPEKKEALLAKLAAGLDSIGPFEVKQFITTDGCKFLLPLGEWVDRKSTRLNSSHVEISYAVFCLKKKKR